MPRRCLASSRLSPPRYNFDPLCAHPHIFVYCFSRSSSLASTFRYKEACHPSSMVVLARPLLLLAAATSAISTVWAQTTTSFSTSSFSTSASTTTSTRTPTTTSSRPPATITVKVGLQHDFQPDVITARKGDVIHFDFYPRNHSVVRAAFKNPCIPYNLVYPGSDLFFSGPKESQPGQTPPTWELTVNDTSPTFFYCSAPGSCIDWAMIGVINPVRYALCLQKLPYSSLISDFYPEWHAQSRNPEAVPGSSNLSAESRRGLSRRSLATSQSE
ncbi:uncharacterized protein B0I36DRAFT_327954 [Microdochium trichocladiopsis]|uniref:Cupredoxin n=1 Tax=Microdochium trichocladiopsis TaxID=1682393 RepID=A0A9P8Y546_9PEZI|nr:uncharacterized protein B0I36DRAFT_327954 [Microdochium trichocladiopsis]KAH7027800.1 hypothetical protein B0I36DRAFT_327954 [Microdochium trichocladiopsis]